MKGIFWTALYLCNVVNAGLLGSKSDGWAQTWWFLCQLISCMAFLSSLKEMLKEALVNERTN